MLIDLMKPVEEFFRNEDVGGFRSTFSVLLLPRRAHGLQLKAHSYNTMLCIYRTWLTKVLVLQTKEVKEIRKLIYEATKPRNLKQRTHILLLIRYLLTETIFLEEVGSPIPALRSGLNDPIQ